MYYHVWAHTQRIMRMRHGLPAIHSMRLAQATMCYLPSSCTSNSTPPIPLLLASISSMKGYSNSGFASMGAEVIDLIEGSLAVISPLKLSSLLHQAVKWFGNGSKVMYKALVVVSQPQKLLYFLPCLKSRPICHHPYLLFSTFLVAFHTCYFFLIVYQSPKLYK